ncbi:hypothetical protein C3F09_02140 [candidate division GN15 bacterium]|uniref:DAGKc domain-containing protein n=1 Tax=candidate division GN15 bacterium TaxID=2072418 RepID=A0A855XBW9_9BACT|nr:MAG: hypothetical protein C3F09_02140 [candidate division GN15 bacterium]
MKVVVIVNPRACRLGPDELRDRFARRLGERLVSVRTTQFPGHACHLAQSIAQDGADVVVAVGGDGTANEVLNGLVGTPAALAVLPTGTANDLATYLHIPTDIEKAITVIAAGRKRRLDVVRVNGWHYLTVGALGLPCETAQRAEGLRDMKLFGRPLTAWIGNRIYLLALIRAFHACCRHRHIVTVSTGTSSFCMDSSSLLLANQPFLGARFHVAPKARPDDHMLDLCLIQHNESRIRLAAATAGVAMGRQNQRSGVIRLRARRLHIESLNPQPFLADGQIRDAATCLDIELIPSAIDVIVPEKRGRR